MAAYNANKFRYSLRQLVATVAAVAVVAFLMHEFSKSNSLQEVCRGATSVVVEILNDTDEVTTTTSVEGHEKANELLKSIETDSSVEVDAIAAIGSTQLHFYSGETRICTMSIIDGTYVRLIYPNATSDAKLTRNSIDAINKWFQSHVNSRL